MVEREEGILEILKRALAKHKHGSELLFRLIVNYWKEYSHKCEGGRVSVFPFPTPTVTPRLGMWNQYSFQSIVGLLNSKS